jgi:NAD dependent epimerase/dehydratase family enzyme
VGYYGNRGDELLTEESAAGTGFLASVCRDWEQASAPASEAGIRVLHLRFGVVLDPSAGALSKMLGLFRKGMGGPIGGGRQYVSWITLHDAVGGILRAVDTSRGR